MSSELVVNATQEGCRIALLRNRSLVEFHYDENERKFNVGDVYLGVVKKVVPGLNAAFIDIGYEKDAFLHYLDLGPQVRSLSKFTKLALNHPKRTIPLTKFKSEPDINKLGKISEVLTRNQQILVQVVKEPISSKGPRLSCELSLAGRFLVLVPFSNTVSISKRISTREERKRLLRLLSSIKPPNFGVIVRTASEGREVAELDKDLRQLVETWEEGAKVLKQAKSRQKVIGEIGRTSSLLRDVLNESFDKITVDDKKMFGELRSYIKDIAPDKQKIVRLYNGKAKVFENYGIERQLKALFGQSVSLTGGGYIIIEHTEALHVVDVNSGNKSSKEEDQENTALSVNREAAKEVARQLQLRDMGGIIVVDFIDMRKAENKKVVYATMKEAMKSDRSKFTILPLSKFGLMQITRQRVRPELNIATKETCPSCQGTGKISASILVSDILEKNLEFLLTKQNESKIAIRLHPYLHAYFSQGVWSRRLSWFWKYHSWVGLHKDSSLGITDFKFIAASGEEIELK